MPSFDSGLLHDYDFSSNLEWIETNGLGGYASATVAGSNTRRYHGLLVAATRPPVGRMVVVSKLDETIVAKSGRFELSANQYPGALHPTGFTYLTDFKRDIFPEFYYEAGGAKLKKTVAAIHGENTTVVLYEVLAAKGKLNLELLPLYACKDYHREARANDSIHPHYLFDEGIFQTLNYQGCPELFISVPGSSFVDGKGWYYNFEHAIEQYRGLDYLEDLYSHGKFSVELGKGDRVGVIISTHSPAGKNAQHLVDAERKRREKLSVDFNYHAELKRLSLAADQFIVKRGELNTIIAGYHWFADWGRDTMISIPGLCLATGRHDDLKNILLAFAQNVSDGMLPNRFPDHGETPEYNTMDATLWYFVAIYKYHIATRDSAFIKLMIPVLMDIIDWHYKGTRYRIRVDPADELLSGGEPGVQLTWMDAKVGDWVVTPRQGKPVEINALWYNALKILALLLKDAGNVTEAGRMEERAKKVKESFNTTFWNKSKGYLFDFIDGETRNDDLRPNQLFAISLPFPLLTRDKATKVLNVVTTHLLTPKGLRSLDKNNPAYQATYGGDVWKRDGAYHQGTVWSFLFGPYIDAFLFVYGEEGKKEAESLLEVFLTHLNERGVGTVSEIFDGEAPHTPRGCIAQAWGVAEALRVAVEHKLLR